jgi:integrase
MKAEFQVTYYLWRDRKDKNGFAPVYLRSKQNSDAQIAHNTGVKIHKAQWPQKGKALKNKPAALLELEGKLKATYRDLVSQGEEPNLNDLLEHLNEKRKPTDNGVIAWCEDYLKSDYSEGQKKAVRTLKTNIAGTKDKPGFSKSLRFDQLTKPRLKNFFEWLTKQGVANNSQYKRLRALINVANHANIDVREITNYELPYETRNAIKVRLNWEEVKKVMGTQTENRVEGVAKNVFLLACFSGLRISDILTIGQGELHAHHYERIQTKTKTPVLVTLHKYNTDLFHGFMEHGVAYTRQALSRALKDVLERSGMTKDVTKHQQVGNNFKTVTVEKYKEISFHSGRRFYSRLLNDLGLGGEIARDELGHSYKNVTELYAGSQEHVYRVARVRKAMETLEETLEQLAGLMKVA